MSKKENREFVDLRNRAMRFMWSQGYYPKPWIAALMAHFAAKKKRSKR